MLSYLPQDSTAALHGSNITSLCPVPANVQHMVGPQETHLYVN